MQPPMSAHRFIRRAEFVSVALLAANAVAGAPRPLPAADHPGLSIYKEHCVRCHGETGGGTTDVPDPLVGDFSVNQLAAYIDETMPEDRWVSGYLYLQGQCHHRRLAKLRGRPVVRVRLEVPWM